MAKQRDNDPKTERDNGDPDVVFHLEGDALRPTKTPYGFIGRNPVQQVVPALSSVDIDLQLTANRPMLLFPTRTLPDVRINSKVGCVVIQPGERTVVTVTNSSAHTPLVVDDREGLVSMYPLVFSGDSAVD